MGEQAVVPSVPLLLGHRHPAAVARLVVAVKVDSIKRAGFWHFAHVS
jgi:hypothetical protein